jgi:hypothetical protein
VTLDNKAVRAGRLGASLDVIVLPHVDKEVIATGNAEAGRGGDEATSPSCPRSTRAGSGRRAPPRSGVRRGGGTLVALSSARSTSSRSFVSRSATCSRGRNGTSLSPGTLVRIDVDPSHPVTFGLPASTWRLPQRGARLRDHGPGPEIERTVLASYPVEPRDVLLSGWIRGEEKLARNAAAVALTYGKGKVVLLGFRPQHRAQTNATFPFLFNALYWSTTPAASSSAVSGR